MIDPFMLRKRPDQTSYQLNNMIAELASMKRSIKIMSDDGRSAIIIGNGQPIDPDTGKPYPFGIYKYQVLGDRLVKIGEVQWTI